MKGPNEENLSSIKAIWVHHASGSRRGLLGLGQVGAPVTRDSDGWFVEICEPTCFFFFSSRCIVCVNLNNLALRHSPALNSSDKHVKPAASLPPALFPSFLSSLLTVFLLRSEDSRLQHPAAKIILAPTGKKNQNKAVWLQQFRGKTTTTTKNPAYCQCGRC